MAKANGVFIERYAQLQETINKLPELRRSGGELAARVYLDNAMAAYALEKLGSADESVYDRLSDKLKSPETADAIIDFFDEFFDCKNIRETACTLLDASAAHAYGSGSRDSGVFYTPMPVARFICRQAIGSYLLNWIYRTTGKRFDTVDEALEDSGSVDMGLAYDTVLRNIRILDSSCGSGIFLEAALDELYALRARVLERAAESMPPEDELKKEIVETCIYGMDIEPYSVEVAALRLRFLLASAKATGPVKTNLSCENALFVRMPESGPFDIIVGNPPYMRVKSMFSGSTKPEGVKMKKDLAAAVRDSSLYRFQEGNLNLYKLFIERNLAFLKDGGSMGLIIPASFLNEVTSEKLRKHLFATCRLEEVVEIPERSRIFGKVNQSTAILVLNKARAREGRLKLRLGMGIKDLENGNGSISVGYEEIAGFTDGRMEVPLLRKPALEWDMMRRLKDIPAFKGGNGVAPVGDISVGNVDETFDKTYISEEATGDIFVKGIHLKEYSVDLSPEGEQPRWVKKEAFLRTRPSALPVISQWRIIGRNTQNKACARRLKFALLPPGYLCSNSIKQIVITDKNIESLYLLSLLNSSTLNWYFELFCSQNNIRNYRIEALPIARTSKDVQEVFARIAKLIISSKGDVRDCLDRMLMDSMVFELYFIDRQELIEALMPLQELDDAKFISNVMADGTIQQKIANIVGDERYRLIREAAFRD